MFKYILLCLIINTVLVGQVRFAAIGDYGKDGYNLQTVTNLINSWNVDFIITLGDNNYNYGAASTIDPNIGKYFNSYIYPYAGSYSPGGSADQVNRFFPSVGNHDHDNTLDISKLQPYLDYFDLTPYDSSSGNERYYDFVWGSVHLFSVSSISVEPDGFRHPSSQSAWLQQQLNNCLLNHTHWRIVYFHFSPYSSQKMLEAMRWPFKDWGVHTVMSGHSHNYERLEIDGLTYFVNGLGGKSKKDFGVLVPGSIIRYMDKFGAMLVEATNSEMILKFITVDDDTIDTLTLTDSALPVELVSFNGKHVCNHIVLNWTTETELNNYGFEIEKRVGSRQSTVGNWETIVFIEGSGNSNSRKLYSYIDNVVRNISTYHYRLKQIDADGSFTYSPEISVTINIPSYSSLIQNYPNPFNPTTTIKYTISNRQLVNLVVYDVIGKEIATLVKEEKPAGTYEAEFDGNQLASGIYFYRIQAGEFFKTKKMILME